MPVVPCATVSPVFGLVSFEPNAFVLLYPEFAGFVTDTTPPGVSSVLSQNFTLATMFLNNTCGSRVQDANQREQLLDLLVAHITFMNQGSNDGAGTTVPPPGIVGRVNTATEGAVSVGAEISAPPSASMAYFAQSKYGFLYWTLTAKYRTFIYVPPCDGPQYGPLGYGPGWGGGCGC